MGTVLASAYGAAVQEPDGRSSDIISNYEAWKRILICFLHRVVQVLAVNGCSGHETVKRANTL